MLLKKFSNVLGVIFEYSLLILSCESLNCLAIAALNSTNLLSTGFWLLLFGLDDVMLRGAWNDVTGCFDLGKSFDL